MPDYFFLYMHDFILTSKTKDQGPFNAPGTS